MPRELNFRIPKVKKEGLNIASKYDEDQILTTLTTCFLDQGYKYDLERKWTVSSVETINSAKLTNLYSKRRGKFQNQSECFTYRIFDNKEIVSGIGKKGLTAKKSSLCQRSVRPDILKVLGKLTSGVHVYKYGDVLLKLAETLSTDVVYLAVFKVVLGKTNSVRPAKPQKALDPTPTADCHISSFAASDSDPIIAQLSNSLVYVYEYNEDNLPMKRPRQVLPYALITLKKSVLDSCPPGDKPADSKWLRNNFAYYIFDELENTADAPSETIKPSCKERTEFSSPYIYDESEFMSNIEMVQSNNKDMTESSKAPQGARVRPEAVNDRKTGTNYCNRERPDTVPGHLSDNVENQTYSCTTKKSEHHKGSFEQHSSTANKKDKYKKICSDKNEKRKDSSSSSDKMLLKRKSSSPLLPSSMPKKVRHASHGNKEHSSGSVSAISNILVETTDSNSSHIREAFAKSKNELPKRIDSAETFKKHSDSVVSKVKINNGQKHLLSNPGVKTSTSKSSSNASYVKSNVEKCSSSQSSSSKTSSVPLLCDKNQCTDRTNVIGDQMHVKTSSNGMHCGPAGKKSKDKRSEKWQHQWGEKSEGHGTKYKKKKCKDGKTRNRPTSACSGAMGSTAKRAHSTDDNPLNNRNEVREQSKSFEELFGKLSANIRDKCITKPSNQHYVSCQVVDRAERRGSGADVGPKTKESLLEKDVLMSRDKSRPQNSKSVNSIFRTKEQRKVEENDGLKGNDEVFKIKETTLSQGSKSKTGSTEDSRASCSVVRNQDERSDKEYRHLEDKKEIKKKRNDTVDMHSKSYSDVNRRASCSSSDVQHKDQTEADKRRQLKKKMKLKMKTSNESLESKICSSSGSEKKKKTTDIRGHGKHHSNKKGKTKSASLLSYQAVKNALERGNSNYAGSRRESKDGSSIVEAATGIGSSDPAGGGKKSSVDPAVVGRSYSFSEDRSSDSNEERKKTEDQRCNEEKQIKTFVEKLRRFSGAKPLAGTGPGKDESMDILKEAACVDMDDAQKTTPKPASRLSSKVVTDKEAQEKQGVDLLSESPRSAENLMETSVLDDDGSNQQQLPVEGSYGSEASEQLGHSGGSQLPETSIMSESSGCRSWDVEKLIDSPKPVDVCSVEKSKVKSRLPSSYRPYLEGSPRTPKHKVMHRKQKRVIESTSSVANSSPYMHHKEEDKVVSFRRYSHASMAKLAEADPVRFGTNKKILKLLKFLKMSPANIFELDATATPSTSSNNVAEPPCTSSSITNDDKPPTRKDDTNSMANYPSVSSPESGSPAVQTALTASELLMKAIRDEKLPVAYVKSVVLRRLSEATLRKWTNQKSKSIRESHQQSQQIVPELSAQKTDGSSDGVTRETQFSSDSVRTTSEQQTGEMSCQELLYLCSNGLDSPHTCDTDQTEEVVGFETCQMDSQSLETSCHEEDDDGSANLLSRFGKGTTTNPVQSDSHGETGVLKADSCGEFVNEIVEQQNAGVHKRTIDTCLGQLDSPTYSDNDSIPNCSRQILGETVERRSCDSEEKDVNMSTTTSGTASLECSRPPSVMSLTVESAHSITPTDQGTISSSDDCSDALSTCDQNRFTPSPIEDAQEDKSLVLDFTPQVSDESVSDKLVSEKNAVSELDNGATPDVVNGTSMPELNCDEALNNRTEVNQGGMDAAVPSVSIYGSILNDHSSGTVTPVSVMQPDINEETVAYAAIDEDTVEYSVVEQGFAGSIVNEVCSEHTDSSNIAQDETLMEASGSCETALPAASTSERMISNENLPGTAIFDAPSSSEKEARSLEEPVADPRDCGTPLLDEIIDPCDQEVRCMTPLLDEVVDVPAMHAPSPTNRLSVLPYTLQCTIAIKTEKDVVENGLHIDCQALDTPVITTQNEAVATVKIEQDGDDVPVGLDDPFQSILSDSLGRIFCKTENEVARINGEEEGNALSLRASWSMNEQLSNIKREPCFSQDDLSSCQVASACSVESGGFSCEHSSEIERCKDSGHDCSAELNAGGYISERNTAVARTGVHNKPDLTETGTCSNQPSPLVGQKCLSADENLVDSISKIEAELKKLMSNSMDLNTLRTMEKCLQKLRERRTVNNHGDKLNDGTASTVGSQSPHHSCSASERMSPGNTSDQAADQTAHQSCMPFKKRRYTSEQSFNKQASGDEGFTSAAHSRLIAANALEPFQMENRVIERVITTRSQMIQSTFVPGTNLLHGQYQPRCEMVTPPPSPAALQEPVYNQGGNYAEQPPSTFYQQSCQYRDTTPLASMEAQLRQITSQSPQAVPTRSNYHAQTKLMPGYDRVPPNGDSYPERARYPTAPPLLSVNTLARPSEPLLPTPPAQEDNDSFHGYPAVRVRSAVPPNQQALAMYNQAPPLCDSHNLEPSGVQHHYGTAYNNSTIHHPPKPVMPTNHGGMLHHPSHASMIATIPEQTQQPPAHTPMPAKSSWTMRHPPTVLRRKKEQIHQQSTHVMFSSHSEHVSKQYPTRAHTLHSSPEQQQYPAHTAMPSYPHNGQHQRSMKGRYCHPQSADGAWQKPNRNAQPPPAHQNHLGRLDRARPLDLVSHTRHQQTHSLMHRELRQVPYHGLSGRMPARQVPRRGRPHQQREYY